MFIQGVHRAISGRPGPLLLKRISASLVKDKNTFIYLDWAFCQPKKTEEGKIPPLVTWLFLVR